MSAMATAHRRERSPLDLDIYCQCGRFLTERRQYADIPLKALFVRIKCERCNKWRWVNPVTGDVLERPERDVA